MRLSVELVDMEVRGINVVTDNKEYTTEYKWQEVGVLWFENKDGTMSNKFYNSTKEKEEILQWIESRDNV